MVVVGIEIRSIDISQFLNIIENCIYWFVYIKSHLFDHIITLGKHLRCDFDISFKNMIEDDVDGLIEGVISVIVQGSYVPSVDSCDDFLL